MECADRTSRICHPIACAWLVDHPEEMSFLGLNLNGCTYCEVPLNCLGEYDEEYLIRDHARYRKIIRDCGLWCQELDERQLDNCIKGISSNTGLKLFSLAIWKLKDVSLCELFATDTLHSIWIGVSSHLLGWIMGFLKKNVRLDLFHWACLTCTKYPNFRKPSKIISAVKK